MPTTTPSLTLNTSLPLSNTSSSPSPTTTSTTTSPFATPISTTSTTTAFTPTTTTTPTYTPTATTTLPPFSPAPLHSPLPFPLTIPASRLHRNTTPWPSPHPHLLLHLPSNRPLTLHRGTPILATISPASTSLPLGCLLWQIGEHDGWLGLRNIASWTYLGRNFTGEVEASAGHHKWWEYLCARAHPEGGYVLMIVNIVAQTMEKIGVADDGRGLCLREEEARWEFVQVRS
ncbi:hypothetical protein QBC34DRAFT_437060 [Podospora aff. communis PSN243]|uniref:Uncharacterized protein n=1 Tax=Podospora aff. communis PSN243 TaxID=3040156 RepID=A0AAV9GTE2_9PEZI|nr:hypothetical protein QBC34DRAFT_437060 [Podospora aff. communis PSN243]